MREVVQRHQVITDTFLVRVTDENHFFDGIEHLLDRKGGAEVVVGPPVGVIDTIIDGVVDEALTKCFNGWRGSKP